MKPLILRNEENGFVSKEYWSARELYKLLGYSTWQKFQNTIEQAKIACGNSEQTVSDHFNLEVKMIVAGKGSKRKTDDYRLSRYACYLIVQNAYPAKPIIALGQSYFAYQTRRQEIADELELTALSETLDAAVFEKGVAPVNNHWYQFRVTLTEYIFERACNGFFLSIGVVA